MTGRKVMATKLQNTPCLGVFQDRFILGITKQDKLVEQPVTGALGQVASYDGLSGNLAVKNPVLANAFGLGLLPDQVVLLKTHVDDIAPSPMQIDGTGDPVGTVGVAHRIQARPFRFTYVT